MTNLSNTIFYLSILIWLLPPFRQYKTFFFSYFLVLGIADILVFFTTKFFEISSYDFYVIVSFCLFIALQEIEYLKIKKILFLVSGLIVIVLSFIKLGIGIHIFSLAFLHLLIIFRILYLFVMVVAQKQAINFFYLVLAFYEFTVLLKFSNYLFPLNVDARAYFYITTGFELLVGIFFTTFREDSRKLVYQLK